MGSNIMKKTFAAQLAEKTIKYVLEAEEDRKKEKFLNPAYKTRNKKPKIDY